MGLGTMCGVGLQTVTKCGEESKARGSQNQGVKACQFGMLLERTKTQSTECRTRTRDQGTNLRIGGLKGDPNLGKGGQNLTPLPKI